MKCEVSSYSGVHAPLSQNSSCHDTPETSTAISDSDCQEKGQHDSFRISGDNASRTPVGNLAMHCFPNRNLGAPTAPLGVETVLLALHHA